MRSGKQIKVPRMKQILLEREGTRSSFILGLLLGGKLVAYVHEAFLTKCSCSWAELKAVVSLKAVNVPYTLKPFASNCLYWIFFLCWYKHMW